MISWTDMTTATRSLRQSARAKLNTIVNRRHHRLFLHRAISRLAISMISTKQGELILGRLIAERDNSLLIAPNPYQPTLTRLIQQSDIATRNDSTFSPMPVGLLNSFSREDILDLLAVLKKGEPPVREE